MRPGTRRRLGLLLRLVIIGAAVGGVYGGLVSLASRGMVVHGALIGVINGALISGCIGGVEIFSGRTSLGRRPKKRRSSSPSGSRARSTAPSSPRLVAGEVGGRLLPLHAVPSPFQNPLAPLSLVFSFAVTFLFIFILEVGRLVGGRALRDVVLGRDHEPRVEERFFLFVDVVGSTSLAERRTHGGAPVSPARVRPRRRPHRRPRGGDPPVRRRRGGRDMASRPGPAPWQRAGLLLRDRRGRWRGRLPPSSEFGGMPRIRGARRGGGDQR